MQSPSLPQLLGTTFISEAGLETDLVFHHEIDLSHFATFPLLDDAAGRETLREYFEAVIDIARRDGTGAVLETATWRANPDWGDRFGLGAEELDRVNRDAVVFLLELRADNPDVPVVISGSLGPRGDGYRVSDAMSPSQAAEYHRPQIRSLRAAGADLVSAFTINHADEATGIVRAAKDEGIPVVISFTLETDGALPSGQGLADAIEEVDAATQGGAAYFMVNCAHPAHFTDVLDGPGPWTRLRGIRANASTLSHEELDNSTELDRGDQASLAADYARIADTLDLAVVGGCCGTDLEHLDAISRTISAGTDRQGAESMRATTVDLTTGPGAVGRFNAWFFDAFDRYINFISRRHKQHAFGDIPEGVVLELGAGVGANFDHIPPGSHVIAVEPNSAMHPRLQRRATAREIHIDLIPTGAERLPLEDASVDTVLCSLVLCTVEDAGAVVGEIHRVLRPGGTFRFVEHVAAHPASPRRWLQASISRPWAWLFDGCRLCRDTSALVERSGFDDIDIRRHRLRRSIFFPVNTSISGIATK